MTLYTPPRSDVFAGGAPPSEIRPFDAWARGLGIAFEETNGFPELQSMNGLFNALNMYIKYLEQNGFAEWRNDLEYPVGAGVRVGLIWYRARTQNTNKPPSNSQTDWELFLNASALSYQEPLYIEDNIIKIRDASQNQRGVAQFANSNDIANKSNISRIVNPSGVATIAQSTDFGVDQDWVNAASQRSLGIFYQNLNDKPREVQIDFPDSYGGQPRVVVTVTTASGSVDIVDNTYDSGGAFGSLHLSFTVPPRRSYRVSVYNTIVQPNKWSELI